MCCGNTLSELGGILNNGKEPKSAALELMQSNPEPLDGWLEGVQSESADGGNAREAFCQAQGFLTDFPDASRARVPGGRGVEGERRALSPVFQMWIARPSTASAASRKASDRVGCAWQVRAMSSLLAIISIAKTPSAIISDAAEPKM